MQRFIWFKCISCATVVATIYGCAVGSAPTETIQSVTTSFGSVVSSSAKILLAEQEEKPNVRRSEAVMAWISSGSSATNIDDNSVGDSFGRYVCAGSGALGKAQAFVEYANAYSTSLEGIVKPAGDTFSQQWRNFLEARKPLSAPSLKESKPAAQVFNDCTNDIKQLIVFKGFPATDTSDETVAAVLASVEAYKALFSALEKVATDALKISNEAEARQRFANFVTSQHEGFRAALSQGMSASKMDEAWQRKKAVALWKPYYSFSEMMKMNRTSQTAEIVRLNFRLHQELAPYDELRGENSPAKIVQAIAKAEDELYRVATDNNLSISSAISILKGLYSDFATLAKDIEDVQKRTNELKTQ